MHRKIIVVAVAVALGGYGDLAAAAKAQPKAGHKFKGTVEVQYRTNSNVSAAPASSGGFDFADASDFDADEEDGQGDEEDEDDDSFDTFDSLDDVDPDEDEIEEDDAIDEDGDGIDDIIDPNADTLVDKERRFTAKLGLSHKYTFEGGEWAWSNGLRLATDTYDQRSDLDKFNYALTSGFEYAPSGKRYKLKPSLSFVTLEKDSSKFVSTYIVSLAYSFELSKTISLGAAYNYQDKNIANPNAPDATVDTLALTADLKLSDNDILKLKYAPKVEDSSLVTRSSDAWGFEVAYTRKLPWDMAAGLGYKFDSVDHKNLQPRRQDDNDTWAIQLEKEFTKQLAMELGFERRNRESNIPGKDAENRSVYLNASYKF